PRVSRTSNAKVASGGDETQGGRPEHATNARNAMPVEMRLTPKASVPNRECAYVALRIRARALVRPSTQAVQAPQAVTCHAVCEAIEMLLGERRTFAHPLRIGIVGTLQQDVVGIDEIRRAVFPRRPIRRVARALAVAIADGQVVG